MKNSRWWRKCCVVCRIATTKKDPAGTYDNCPLFICNKAAQSIRIHSQLILFIQCHASHTTPPLSGGFSYLWNFAARLRRVREWKQPYTQCACAHRIFRSEILLEKQSVSQTTWIRTIFRLHVHARIEWIILFSIEFERMSRLEMKE